MQFCEKKVKKISLAYPVNNKNFAQNVQRDAAGWNSPSHPIPGPKKVRRRSREISQSLRRKSSLYSGSQLPTPDILKLQTPIPHGETSVLSQSGKSKMANGMSTGFTPHQGEFHEYHRKCKDTNITAVNDEQSGYRANSLPSAVLPNDLNCSVSHHHQYFIRALTTLAINNLTLTNTSNQERRASHNFYDRNIKSLLDSPMRHESRKHQYQLASNVDLNKYEPSLESSSTSSSQRDEERSFQVDNREKINRLRNYLKCSGLGEPIVVKVFNQETQEFQQSIHRLVRRVHKGLSPERRERLRLKTHLEYEMSLMKGECFCEEQDQMWMRTASADMGDRDQQLLEEEVKHQLIQGLKSDDLLDVGHNKALRDVYEGGRQLKLINGKADHPISNKDTSALASGVTVCHNEDNDYPWFLKVQDDEDTRGSQDDNMSGTWRSPFSRREMRRRVFSWVKDVENAMGLEWKEKMRLTYGRNLTQDKTTVTNNDDIKNTALTRAS